jgi:hypothetical protein
MWPYFETCDQFENFGDQRRRGRKVQPFLGV